MANLLSLSTLSSLNDNIGTLRYDPKAATAGIVHIGIGAFHRAHQAVYTDDLIATGDNRWKITAVSLRSAGIRDAMQPQDYLYSVVERSNEQDKIRVIAAINRVLVAPENPQAVIDELASTTTKVVTLTITEKGYCRDKSGQHLDLNNPIIQADLADLSAPKSLPGFLVAACKVRQLNNDKLTVISCDNLPSNGDVTRTVVIEFAEQADSKLAQWIQENVSFCNSMVDRIVPATTQADINQVEQQIGVTDNSVVITEPFKQWVIEDNFVTERPCWDSVGALFVKDVSAFEEMKLRLLNGAHSTLAYVGFLMGYEYIHQAVNDPRCLTLVKMLHQRLLGTLGAEDNIDLPEYANTILARFANQGVPYKTTQVACDGSQKLSQRLLKPAEILSQAGDDYQAIAFVVAAWCRFLEGKNHLNQTFEVIDPLAESLSLIANQHKANEVAQVSVILAELGTASEVLLANEAFIAQVAHHLSVIHQQGTEAALVEFINSVESASE